MQKLIFRNKYTLIVFIILILLLVDVFLHKGLVRFMLKKNFPEVICTAKSPTKNAILINNNKEWIKAVNTKEIMAKVDVKTSGIELDIYFDSSKLTFDVHHDLNNSIGLNLDNLLQVYKDRNLDASIWIDFKNLNDSNCLTALNELIMLRNKYNLKNKILVESNRTDLLKLFGKNNFYTSYYTPYFNPYLINDDSLKHLVTQLEIVINNSNIDALSGYYFQYAFLHKYFPQYPILIWSPNDKWSIVNNLYKAQVRNTNNIFIALYSKN